MTVIEERHDYTYRTEGERCRVLYVTTTVTVDDNDLHTTTTVEQEIGFAANRVEAMHVADRHRETHR